MEESLVNFGNIVGEVRGIMIKKKQNRKRGIMIKKKPEPKKGRVKEVKKVKVQRKEGIMEFVVCIMANPFSNRGAFCPIHPRVPTMERPR